MIGQLPPFAISSPVFRFRSLASHAGRVSLGGDREVALACFAVARLGAGMVLPMMLAHGDATARASATKNWQASLTLPAPVRTAVTNGIDAVAGGDRRAAGEAIREMIAAAAVSLDSPSIAELEELAAELTGGRLA